MCDLGNRILEMKFLFHTNSKYKNVHVHIIYKVAKEYLFNNSIAASSLFSCLYILD